MKGSSVALPAAFQHSRTTVEPKAFAVHAAVLLHTQQEQVLCDVSSISNGK